MYEILVESSAESDLKRLRPEVLRRVVSRIRSLAAEPRPAGCRKIAGSKNDWRIRVGDHRVLYEVDEKSREVRIMRVRHRSEAYR